MYFDQIGSLVWPNHWLHRQPCGRLPGRWRMEQSRLGQDHGNLQAVFSLEPMGRAGPHLRWNRILTTSFTFNHSNYVEQINQITINKEENITKEEMTQARAVLGAIQRRAIQSGPQHSAKLPVRRVLCLVDPRTSCTRSTNFAAKSTLNAFSPLPSRT